MELYSRFSFTSKLTYVTGVIWHTDDFVLTGRKDLRERKWRSREGIPSIVRGELRRLRLKWRLRHQKLLTREFRPLQRLPVLTVKIKLPRRSFAKNNMRNIQ